MKASGVRLDRDLPSESPPVWAQDLELTVVPGAAGFREITFFHRPSRTLVLTDLVVNLETGKLPLPARAFAWATGVLAPDGKAPAYLRFIVKRRARVAPLAHPKQTQASRPLGASCGTWTLAVIRSAKRRVGHRGRFRHCQKADIRVNSRARSTFKSSLCKQRQAPLLTQPRR